MRPSRQDMRTIWTTTTARPAAMVAAQPKRITKKKRKSRLAPRLAVAALRSQWAEKLQPKRAHLRRRARAAEAEKRKPPKRKPPLRKNLRRKKRPRRQPRKSRAGRRKPQRNPAARRRPGRRSSQLGNFSEG